MKLWRRHRKRGPSKELVDARVQDTSHGVYLQARDLVGGSTRIFMLSLHGETHTYALQLDAEEALRLRDYLNSILTTIAGAPVIDFPPQLGSPAGTGRGKR